MGLGSGWTDVALFALSSTSCPGWASPSATTGYFTHGSFKAQPAAARRAGRRRELAIEGPVIRWVADHRRHHAFSDREGDPHSPVALRRIRSCADEGFLFAHVGWILMSSTPMAEGRPRSVVPRHSAGRSAVPVVGGLSVLGSPLLGGLITWSWAGAVSACSGRPSCGSSSLHHVTWSINSVCHTIGERPFAARDKSANFWPLAVISFGESLARLTAPTRPAARHGVLRGQLDPSARVIWVFEKLGWAREVRWPKPERLARLRA